MCVFLLVSASIHLSSIDPSNHRSIDRSIHSFIQPSCRSVSIYVSDWTRILLVGIHQSIRLSFLPSLRPSVHLFCNPSVLPPFHLPYSLFPIVSFQVSLWLFLSSLRGQVWTEVHLSIQTDSIDRQTRRCIIISRPSKMGLVFISTFRISQCSSRSS